MARAALPGRLTWQLGSVVELRRETAAATSVVLDVPQWSGHRAGQHVDVRLTAEDGYQAQRSYSIASGPADEQLVLTIERIDDGEVSPYLTDELRPGDELELRGPIGGYFVWEEDPGGPVLLLAGGSGIVPFRSMLRHRATSGSSVPVRLVHSARTLAEVIYREELSALREANVYLTLTREPADGWDGHRGRIDAEWLGETAWPASENPLVFACGPSGFVESAAELLVGRGHDPGRIRTERFGPTGG